MIEQVLVTYKKAPSIEQIRWGSNADPSLYLNIGQAYALKEYHMRSYHCKVELVEFPGVLFNAISFTELPADIITAAEIKWKQRYGLA